MNDAAVYLAKILIVVLFAVLLGCQIVVIPAMADQSAAMFPEAAGLRVPGIVITVALLACVQVVLVCVWRLLSMVSEGSIFSASAFVWVDVIIGAIFAAVALVAGGMLVLNAWGVGGPAIVEGALAIVVGVGLALVVIVLKGLLRRATELAHDLSEVV